MATKKNPGVKTPKNEEKKNVQQTAPVDNDRPQYKIPFISAKIDRLNDNPESKIKANASVTIGNHFAVHGFKVYDGGEKGMQVLCPGHKSGDKFYEDFHPVSKEAREALNGYILDAYEQKLEQTQEEGQSEDENLDEDEEPAFEQTMQVFMLNN